MFNYLKALESNNGTKYLLDVQQDAVKSEAEIAQLKSSVESLRSKIQSLQERQIRLRRYQGKDDLPQEFRWTYKSWKLR